MFSNEVTKPTKIVLIEVTKPIKIVLIEVTKPIKIVLIKGTYIVPFIVWSFIMQWINVNEKYLDYLRTYEKRIPMTDYGTDRYKPFFGILFETDELYYITQISHAQARHKNMKKQPDFFKIYDPQALSRLIAVVNLNYMFPIPKNEVTPFIKSQIDTYRTFKSVDEKSKYIDLLDSEMKMINTLNLSEAAEKLYTNKYKFPESKVSQRCLDYKKLEDIALKWAFDR
jgi:protein AbiQ